MTIIENNRWKQRLDKALSKLNKAVQKAKNDFYTNNKFDKNKFNHTDDIIVEGIIQRFEHTHELDWKVMKDFL